MSAREIAAIAVDEGLYMSNGDGRAGKITSLASTMHAIVTRYQDGKPASERVFYRTDDKRPDPESHKLVHYFGLTDSNWKRSAIGRDVQNVAARNTAERRIPVLLGPRLQDSVGVLVESGKFSTEAEALAWLAEQGQEARHEYIGDLRSALELLRNVREAM
jgi:hypothetical protein